MAANSEWSGTARRAHAEDLPAIARGAELQNDRIRVWDHHPAGRPDSDLRGNRTAPAPPRFTNRFSPAEHRDCIDPLCLVCIEAEQRLASKPAPWMGGDDQPAHDLNVGEIGFVAKVVEALARERGRTVQLPLAVQRLQMRCERCQLVQFVNHTETCVRCKVAYSRRVAA